ncbi:uncharacterized protein BKA55DRAFT_583986 [Fusarium redolens]|uniref:Uncharacterized protein n=1 Tax=Fusarium redolens TaxID=48865 RepID=A0A9P9G0B9_FUSRE|nr:uncharacterized protein BKA55DRAFT_583986 [Fusarium redolens]KAH7228590.1 hypothetical protein BKA55DRAFT_583986 [Fusarium redolens]
MVDNLRQDDSNAQIATLMDQLGKVTKERDNLLQVLDSLSSTIRRHIGDNSSATTTSEPRSETKSESPAYAGPTKSQSQSAPNDRVVPIIVQRSASETSNSTILQPPINPPPHDRSTYDGWNYAVSNQHYPTTMAFDNSILPSAGNGFIPIQPLFSGLPPTPEEVDVIIPKAPVLCHCSSPTNCTSKKLSAEELAIEDYNAEDIPVRAIVEGWESVEMAGKMTPTWRKRRRADELCSRQLREYRASGCAEDRTARGFTAMVLE